MHSFSQRQASFIWQSLPHLLMWLGLLLWFVVMGLHPGLRDIQPALPLMIALLWSWEWRSPTIALSLLLGGLVTDMLTGLPMGWHALTWVMIYLLLPLLVDQFAEDEPLAGRLFIIGGCLAALLWVELLLAAIYGLAIPTFASMVMRWLVMLLCLPPASWIMMRIKRAAYKKLWMLLPDEMRVTMGET